MYLGTVCRSGCDPKPLYGPAADHRPVGPGSGRVTTPTIEAPCTRGSSPSFFASHAKVRGELMSSVWHSSCRGLRGRRFASR